MNNKGYTLIEILAVLAIIAVVSSIVSIRMQSSLNNIETSACLNKMKVIALAEKRFFTTKGQHSMEFMSGNPIDSEAQLVKEGYLDWQTKDCQGEFRWVVIPNGYYILTCSTHTNNRVQQHVSDYDNVLFVEFPDDGITTGDNNPGGGSNGSNEPTPGDDYLLGTDEDDEINAESGDDIVYGGDGNDEINGEKGDDLLFGGSGEDEIEGGQGDDNLYGESGDDELEGNNGNDEIHGGYGDDEIEGGNHNDILYGDEGNDTLEGGNGEDHLYGGLGNDYLDGGNGNNDKAYYSYPYTEYSMMFIGRGRYIISHPIEGNDTLVSIEIVNFPNLTASIGDLFDLIKE